MVSEDGTLIDTTKRITLEGLYYVVITDIAGNSAELTLLIDKTAPTARFETASGQVLNNGATTNEPFRIICEEQDSKITYSFNGGAAVKYTDELLSESGTYVFSVTDFLGTAAELRISVDTGVKLTVNGTYVIDDAGKYVSKNWLSVTLGEDMQSFYIQAQDGTMLEADGRITAEGEYTVYAKDESGNERKLVLVIDKTAPVIILEGVVEDGATNELVNGQVVDAVIDGDMLSLTENGNYKLSFVNANSNWQLELCVDNVAPSVQFENTRKSVIISQPNKENMTYTLYYNGAQTTFNLKNSVELTKVGNYRLVCVDEVGNITEYIFELNYLSDISIALICVVSALVVVVIVALVVFRFKRKIY